MLTVIYSSKTFLNSTHAISSNFFHLDLVSVTAFCIPPELRTSKFKNFVTFFITSSSSTASPSSSVLPVKPEHFMLTKSVALLRHFRIPEQFLRNQQLHLIREMELLATLLQTKHENLEVFIATAVFSPVQKAFVFFRHGFFPSRILIFGCLLLEPNNGTVLYRFCYSTLTLMSVIECKHNCLWTSQLQDIAAIRLYRYKTL